MYIGEIRDEFDSVVAWHKENMPQRIKSLIGLAAYDLWHGPIFYDAETLEETDSESGIAFPFETACRELREWAENNISAIRVESWHCEITDHSETEEIDGSETEIKKALFGKSLAEYI